MTYYGSKDLARSFRQVRANTLQIANEIPEEKYGFNASPETRTIGQTLAHIALAPRVQTHVHQNRFTDAAIVPWGELIMGVAAEETKPRTKAEVIALLNTEGESFANYLESLGDDFLSEPVTMPSYLQPAAKSRFEMLMSPKEHEMHHRGQLMMLQRMIGQVPHLTRQMLERMAPAAKA